ncbi:MAG TPA: FliM/FliN family flagellar motor switch protein [Solirubrobacteraceae bacterium]|nr:FliM/FliN family flagellar motor switch protein [Solirubrobacteraceae bacterium]
MSSTETALMELANSTAEAVGGVLRMFLPDGVEIGEATIVPQGLPPLDGVAVPAVAAEVSYTDGASGGNLFVTTIAGVRKLAAAMMGMEPDPGSHPLDELELSAVAEAMNQMMAAAAGATSKVLGDEVEISTPEVRDVVTVEDALLLGEGAPHATGVTFSLAGEPCRLIQLVPKAFVLKMTRALDDMNAVEIGGGSGGPDGAVDTGVGSPHEILRSVQLRVCAEIGRATMPMSDAVSRPAGAVIELDRGADEPVDLMVNGRRFATGRLVLVEDEWAVRIEEVLGDASDLPMTTSTSIERS